MPRRYEVRAMRTAMGLTEADFAERVGVSERTIYRWEHEGVEPSPMAIKHLRRVRAEHERDQIRSANTAPSASNTSRPASESASASTSSLLPVSNRG